MKTGGMKELWAKGFVKCATIVLLGAFAFGATMGCGTTKKTAKKTAKKRAVKPASAP